MIAKPQRILYPMPDYWADPNPAGRPLNQPKPEGKLILPHSNKDDAFMRDTEMPLKPSGRYSAQSLKRHSVDHETLMRFKEEKEMKKGKLGSDRMKLFDDVYSS